MSGRSKLPSSSVRVQEDGADQKAAQISLNPGQPTLPTAIDVNCKWEYCDSPHSL